MGGLKKPICRGELLEKCMGGGGWLGQFADLRERALAKKTGLMFLRGGGGGF